MAKGFVATATTQIRASRAKVWNALTNPDLIEKYLFGTRVSSDWRVGSPIIYRGTWQGKEYEDKGTVLESIPNDRLVTTFWSSLSGIPDKPENYKTIRYELTDDGDATRLTITQDNNDTPEEAQHSEGNWRTVLASVKELLEA